MLIDSDFTDYYDDSVAIHNPRVFYRRYARSLTEDHFTRRTRPPTPRLRYHQIKKGKNVLTLCPYHLYFCGHGYAGLMIHSQIWRDNHDFFMCCYSKRTVLTTLDNLGVTTFAQQRWYQRRQLPVVESALSRYFDGTLINRQLYVNTSRPMMIVQRLPNVRQISYSVDRSLTSFNFENVLAASKTYDAIEQFLSNQQTHYTQTNRVLPTSVNTSKSPITLIDVPILLKSKEHRYRVRND